MNQLKPLGLKAVDFFCGGGGMTNGLRQSGVNVIVGIDFDPDCKQTYEINNPGSQFCLADIKKLDVRILEDNFSIRRNDDNLIFVGCSPCQYYSAIKTSKTKSITSKNLLLDFARFIDYYRPGFVLVENVPGIITNKESVLPDFLDFLYSRGYKYEEHCVVDMSYYGVPQTRKRFSMIASRIVPVSLPLPEGRRALLSDYIGRKNGFRPIPAGYKDPSGFDHTTSNLSDINIRRLEKTPPNGGSRFHWKDDSELQLKCFWGRDDSFRDTFGRMYWDRPAPTITTKFFSISNGRFAHPNENRAISLREGATIQTFPKEYIFKTSSIARTAKLIGNAVPPEYAKRLAAGIRHNLSLCRKSVAG